MRRTDVFMTSISLVTVLGLSILSSAAAQTGASGGTQVNAVSSGSTNVDDRWRQKIDEVYADATQVATLDELEELKKSCRALRVNAKDDESRAYLTRLAAWLYNRHGEMLTRQAAEHGELKNEEELERLERLAVEQFSMSIQLQPNFRALHNRGVSYASLGKFTEAVDDFGTCLRLNPSYANARFNRGELSLELGDYEAAEADYSAVLRQQPDDVAALIGRGHVRFYRGQFEESLMDFDDAIRNDPQNALAHADRADLHAYLGRWEDAARDYRAAIRLDGKLGRAYQSASWLMATCPDGRFRDERLALRAAERAIELDGQTDYRYLDTLAAAQANANQFDDAQKSVRLAMQAAPQDVIAELTERLTMYRAQRPFREAQP